MKNINFSKLVIVFCVCYIALFVLFVLFVNFKGNEVSDTLIKYTFYFFGLEVLALAGIKIADVVSELIKNVKKIS